MKKLLIFLLGAGAGSAITWYITKETYKKIADEEIESVVEKFKERENEINNMVKGISDENPNLNYKESNEDISQPEQNKVVDINSFKQIVKDENYQVGVDTGNGGDYTIMTQELPEKIAPYIISEDEYGNADYEEKTLMLCADNILLDEGDEIIDPESIIGDTLNHFNKYDEYLYVRDDNEQMDYIIVRSEKVSSEIISEEGNE